MAARLRFPVLAALAVLVPFGALNAVLAIDLAARIWTLRDGFARPGDAQLLILVEVARAVATLLALLAAVRLGAARSALERRLGLCLALLAVAYVQAFTFPAFPGRLQEALARSLLEAGASRSLLVLVFGTPSWALWLALGAALRAGAAADAYAGPDATAGVDALRAADGERPAGAGRLGDGGTAPGARRGIMRGSRVAGTDVGALFRRAAAAAAARGWLGAAVVWPAVVAVATLHIAAGGALDVPLALVFALGAGLALARLRAVAAGAHAQSGVRLGWIATGAAAAVAGLLVGGALTIAVPRAERAPLLVLAVAPLAVAACLTGAAFARRGPGRTFGRIAHGGALAVIAVIAFGTADTLLALLFEVPPTAAVVAAGVVGAGAVALARGPLVRAERLLMRPVLRGDAERQAGARRSGD